MSNNGQRPLNDFPDGCRARITDFLANCSARCRLCALGLLPGTVVEIISCRGATCRLRVKNTDLLLDADMASKIMAVTT